MNGTTYYYAVRSIVTGAESANSLVVQAATPVARVVLDRQRDRARELLPGQRGLERTNAAPSRAGGIEGYATAQSVNEGESVDLKVNSGSAFNIEIYRTGFVRRAPAPPLLDHPRRPGHGAAGVRERRRPPGSSTAANWSTSATITTTAAWPSGVYLLRIVRDRQRAATTRSSSSSATTRASPT